jgi:hypothetical protein
MAADFNEKVLRNNQTVGAANEDHAPPPGKEPGSTSGNDDYGSTEREPDDGHDRVDEPKPHL